VLIKRCWYSVAAIPGASPPVTRITRSCFSLLIEEGARPSAIFATLERDTLDPVRLITEIESRLGIPCLSSSLRRTNTSISLFPLLIVVAVFPSIAVRISEAIVASDTPKLAALSRSISI